MDTNTLKLNHMGSFYEKNRGEITNLDIIKSLQGNIKKLSFINKIYNMYLDAIDRDDYISQNIIEKFLSQSGIKFEESNEKKIELQKAKARLRIVKGYINTNNLLKIPENTRISSNDKQGIIARLDRANGLYEVPNNCKWNNFEMNVLLGIIRNKLEISGLPHDIDWKEDEKNRLLDIAEEKAFFTLNIYDNLPKPFHDRKISAFPENINWSEEQVSRILDIVRKSEISFFDPKEKSLEYLTKYEKENKRNNIFPTNINWSYEQKNTILEIVEEKGVLELLPKELEWDETQKDRILSIAEKSGSLFGLPQNITWSETQKQRILDIVNKSESIIGLPQNIKWTEEEKTTLLNISKKTLNIYDLPQNEEWNEKQIEEIIKISINTNSAVRFPNAIKWDKKRFEQVRGIISGLSRSTWNNDFTEEEKDIFIEKEREFVESYSGPSMVVDYFKKWRNEKLFPSLDRIEVLDDDEEVQFELIELFIKENDYKLLPKNVKWTDSAIKRLVEHCLFNNKGNIFENGNDYRDRVIDIINSCKKFKMNDFAEIYLDINESVKRKVDYYDPISCSEIKNDIDFFKFPQMQNKDINELSYYNLNDQKVFLLKLLERLNLLGVIDSGVKIDNKRFKRKEHNNYEDIKKKIESLDPVDDRVLVAANLAFYLNKLTKTISIQMYTKGLNGVDVDDEKEERLTKVIKGVNVSYSFSRNQQIGDHAYNKNKLLGNELINTIRFLHGGDPDLVIQEGIEFERNSNFEYIRRKNGIKLTFSEFIQNIWLENYNRTNEVILGDQEGLSEFIREFNSKIRYLKMKGCSNERLVHTMIYVANSLDTMSKLYGVKDQVLTNLMQYSLEDKYKDEIMVQIEDNQSKEDEFTDVAYVYVDGIAMPMAFHTNLQKRVEKTQLSKVNPKVKSFYDDREGSLNVVYPITDGDRVIEFMYYPELERLVPEITKGEYKAITNVTNLRDGDFLKIPDNVDKMNRLVLEFLFKKEFEDIDDKDKSVLPFSLHNDTVVANETLRTKVEEKKQKFNSDKAAYKMEFPEYDALLDVIQGLYDRVEYQSKTDEHGKRIYYSKSIHEMKMKEARRKLNDSGIKKSDVSTVNSKLVEKQLLRRNFTIGLKQGLAYLGETHQIKGPRKIAKSLEEELEEVKKKNKILTQKNTDLSEEVVDLKAKNDELMVENKTIKEENVTLKERLAELELELKDERERHEQTKKALESSQGMLRLLMKIVEKIKKSPIGKLFSRKDKKNLPPANDKEHDDR